MKVVLLQDVAKIGRRFEVVNVPDGHALNKLIPQKQAQPATKANVKRVEALKQKQAAESAGEAEAFAAAIAALSGQTVTVEADTNPEGKLFEALKLPAIVTAANDQFGTAVQESWVHVANPIKQTGEHTVLLSRGEEQGEFSVNVVSKQ